MKKVHYTHLEPGMVLRDKYQGAARILFLGSGVTMEDYRKDWQFTGSGNPQLRYWFYGRITGHTERTWCFSGWLMDRDGMVKVEEEE